MIIFKKAKVLLFIYSSIIYFFIKLNIERVKSSTLINRM